MEKRQIVSVVANVAIKPSQPQVNEKGFVRFILQSTGGGVSGGASLFVFDSRPAVFEAAKAYVAISEDKYQERNQAEEALTHVLFQAAKVVVMEKVDGERSFQYVNLFPVNGQPATALLTCNSYTSKHNAGYEVQEDGALWSWKSYSSSRTGAHGEMVIVSLTDKEHRVVVRSYGYANIGHSNQNLTVIDAKQRQISEEEMVVDMEP